MNVSLTVKIPKSQIPQGINFLKFCVMNKKFIWLVASLFVGALAIAACGDFDEQNGSATTNKVNYEKTGGNATLTMSNGTKVELVIPQCTDDNVAGVSFANNTLTANSYQEDANGSTSLYLTIDGYNENQKEYENVSFSFYQNQEGSYVSCQSIVPTRVGDYGNKVTVEKQSDDSYRIVIEGDMVCSSNDNPAENYNEPNSTVALEFVMTLAAKASVSSNVTGKKSMYPDFTPWLGGKTVAGAYQIEQSQLMTSGVMLWYYDTSLTYADYEALKEQAVKALGEPVESFDADAAGVVKTDGEWTDFACSYFYKDGNFIMVSYCPWRIEEGPNYYLPTSFDVVKENQAARIQVHAFEGITFDYTALISRHW
mgnify:FL=1